MPAGARGGAWVGDRRAERPESRGPRTVPQVAWHPAWQAAITARAPFRAPDKSRLRSAAAKRRRARRGRDLAPLAWPRGHEYTW